MKKLFTVITPFLLLPLLGLAQQHRNALIDDSLVEVSGVVVTSDSLRNIPGVTVFIKGENRGTIANDEGVFSIVAEKGDTLVFRVIGFKKKEVMIPENIKGHFLGIAQPLEQDTTYLPLTVVHSYPSKEEFEDAFLHWNIPSDQYDIARANTAADLLRSASRFTGPDGGEGVSHTFRSRQEFMRSRGQMPTMNIFNPLAWAQFIKALKDGDFKRKD